MTIKRHAYIITALAVLILIYLSGYLFPASRTVSASVVIDAPLEAVWNTITDLEGQTSWRSDLKAVRISSTQEGEERWVEYLKKSPAVSFHTSIKIPDSRFEIYFSPGYGISGTGTALLKESGDGGTILYVEDTVRAENPLVRMSFYFLYNPKKTMERYMQELKDHLEQE